jgi:hypothetical protein
MIIKGKGDDLSIEMSKTPPDRSLSNNQRQAKTSIAD